MHPSLITALQSLDEYIAFLTDMRNKLAQGGQAKALATVAAHHVRSNGVRSKKTSKATTAVNGSSGGTRKGQVTEYINVNGPSLRSEIQAGTGMPAGTLAYALNDKERFTRLSDGRWENAKTN